MTTTTEIDLENLLTESAQCEWDHVTSDCTELATHVVGCRCERDFVLACDTAAAIAQKWIDSPTFDCDMCGRLIGDCWWMRVA